MKNGEGSSDGGRESGRSLDTMGPADPHSKIKIIKRRGSPDGTVRNIDQLYRVGGVSFESDIFSKDQCSSMLSSPEV